MNPFDLPGPQFLAFYAMLGVSMAASLYFVKQHAEGGEPTRLPMSDPYAIAYLRGGAAAAVELGVVVLVDRQLLDMGADDRIVVRDGVTKMHGANDLEQAILGDCAFDRHPREVVESTQLKDAARGVYEPTLVRLGLFAGHEVLARRYRHVAAAIIVLAAVAVIKIGVGLARNRPVSFLVASAVLFSVLALLVIKGIRTVRGDRVLGDLHVLFDALRHRAKDMQPYVATNELALLIAVFGLEVVPPLVFPFRRAFRRHATSGNTSSCASGCGTAASSCGSSSSSCGGGGSSCGGGGGGCGGCGSS